MPTATFTLTNDFIERGLEVVNLATDAFKLVLSNSVIDASDAVLADITEIANGNGYTTGGLALTVSSSSQTGGTYKWVLDDLTIQASGGSVGPFRYLAIIDDTVATPTKPIVGFMDYGSSVTLTDGQSLLVDFSAANGALQAMAA